MDGAEPANGEAAVQRAANEGRDAVEAAANEQRGAGGSSRRDGGSPGAANEELGTAGAASNQNAPLQGSSNEGKGSPGSSNEQSALGDSANEDRGGQHGPANEEAEPHDLTNETKGPQQLANEDAQHEASANEVAAAQASHNNDAAAHGPANEEAAPGAAANEDSALPSPTNGRAEPSACPALSDPPANQHAALPDPANGAPLQRAEPSNELQALPAPPTRTKDPWDWSLEEAWLRAPEGEGLEAWGAGPEELEEEDEEDDDNDEDTEEQEEEGQQWWHSPDGAISKQILRRGRGLSRPGPGSLCRVLLSAPRVPPGWGPPSAASHVGRWQLLRVGAGEGAWAAALDAALETMARGERARLRPGGAGGAALGVRLGGFTRAEEFWASPPGRRRREAAAWAARAAALLAAGAAWPAAARAHARALRAAVAAGGPPPLAGEAAAARAELHAGLALCQLRLGLPAAAAANAGKALALRPAHLEARFRRAVAAAAMADLEAAMADLADVLRAQPGHAGARRELRRVRGAARERDARLARRLGRLFA